MDKIFNEIKKAIEEEMRNAESGPPPGGGRPQGGRRAQEYADWLKEEQDRLRGGPGQQVSQPEVLEEVPVEMPEAEERQSRRADRDGRRSGQSQQSGQRQQRDRQGQGSRRQQREQQSRQQAGDQSQRQERQQRQQRDRRQQQQRQRVAQPQTAADMRHRIERQLKSPGGLRQAFLMREIVSKPVSLRDKDEHLIS
jgi:hypothetical protein